MIVCSCETQGVRSKALFLGLMLNRAFYIEKRRLMARIKAVLCHRNNTKQVVLPFLLNKVFHVTSSKAYSAIIDDQEIRDNKNSNLGFTFPQSQNSYGRNKGFVCLFDLRGKTQEVIDESLMKFNFLNPINDKKTIFLIISSREHSRLIPWTEAMKDVGCREVWVPNVECWYDGNIPLKHIEQIIEVTYKNE